VAAIRHRRAGQLGLGLWPDREPQAGHQETWVDYDQDRAPLLFIGGEKDHIMPPSVNRSNARHYENSPALTEYFEFEGRDHWTCGAPGWEAVADHALDWAAKHARTTTST
jgi:pimeloyl-ACP methyl ester carboxylesterase